MTLTVPSTRPSPWDDFRRDFATSLKAEGKSPNTIRLYTGAVAKLAAWCTANGGPADPIDVTRTHLATFLAGRTEQAKPATVSLEYRALQQFFGWMVREDEIEQSPMAKMRPPAVPETPVPVLTDDQLRTLLASCGGTDFSDRRDTAIIRMLLDTGCRRAEIANLTLGDVDLADQVIYVVGKGARPRIVPFGSKTAQALGRYLRTRGRDPYGAAHTSPHDRLWLAPNNRGPLHADGIRQMLERRGGAVGLPGLHATSSGTPPRTTGWPTATRRPICSG